MPSRPEIVLIASPLLGPSIWAPVIARLRANGWRARVLEPLANANQPEPGSILVAHSNAGAYVPQLAMSCDAVSLIFVDAILPGRSGQTPLAPAAAMAQLAALSGADGILPPWSQWWEASDVIALFPDEDTRRLVEADQPRVPFSYFEGTVDAPEGWDERPSAYVAFGETYAAEILEAERRGWPTKTLEGRHLHMLVDPDIVTNVLLELIDKLAQL
jgi:hypothetical protein